MKLDPWYEARDRMVDAVVADLYGGPSEEEISESPLDRFIMGILHPTTSAGTLEEVEFADEVPEGEVGAAQDATYDPGVSLAHARYPSTIGMTFGMSDSTAHLEIEVEADRYEPVNEDVPSQSEEIGSRASSGRASTWRRIGFRPERVAVDLSAPKTEYPLTSGLELRLVVRPARKGVVSVTVVLLNSAQRPEKGAVDALCWFRPVIRVHTVGGEFADRRRSGYLGYLDSDERSGELLYSDQRHLAVGHGVAVTWAEAPIVTAIETTFFPQHELSLARAERDDVQSLGMETLAAPGVYEPLHGLVAAYEDWIRLQDGIAGKLTGELAATGLGHLDEARSAGVRMRRGIELLTANPEADRAFRIMNAVMQQQRVRQEMIRNGFSEPPTNVHGEWRPFQIAFILLNLEGLIDPTSPERDVADLLWFPTGGGKTEAYLGLIAFTLVLRRLRAVGEDATGAGVGVIMRYTLRLLTLQQFERAAGLICALEEYRRGESGMDLRKSAPFSIGLWVGQGATPNNLDKAARALKKRMQNEDPGEDGDPVQLLRCPWCGAHMDASAYNADKLRNQMTVRCPNVACRFRTGLPVHLIDSDVYNFRPSLVIGTVDKFAMLAWKAESGRLFGAAGDAPPDLIVQDELHLIGGPLGTLVGLYETAIDHLASDPETGARPKLVASTATIRRASRQVEAVFARKSRQFPPPGLRAADSFFAVDAERNVKGTRRYVGLMAPTTSHATLLVRTYAALLQGAADLDAAPEVKDAYWTLLGYFNSLRVLGAAYIQTIDDVRDRIRVVASRNGKEPRQTRDPRELTSRIKSSEIPRELEVLQTSHPDAGAPDIVLATNMISVGVDVDRLGLMAVMGQPQTTAEYIQSTSRVGRKHPGLVFTLFNAQRSRDLSHYEAFTTYHRALYKQVEATGATPFAERALDRGLHGVLVMLARHTIAGAAGDKDVSVAVETDELAGIVNIIVDRAARIDPESVEHVREALENLIETWTHAAESKSVVKYPNWGRNSADAKALLIPAGSPYASESDGSALLESFPPTEVPWPTLTSLRNVDQESTLRIIRSYKKAVSPDGDN